MKVYSYMTSEAIMHVKITGRGRGRVQMCRWNSGLSCADPENFVRGGPTLTMIFHVFLVCCFFF